MFIASLMFNNSVGVNDKVILQATAIYSFVLTARKSSFIKGSGFRILLILKLNGSNFVLCSPVLTTLNTWGSEIAFIIFK